MTEQLPAEFLERLQRVVARQDLPGVLESFHQPKNVGFRVNTLRAQPADIWESLSREGISVDRVSWYAAAGVVSANERAALLASTPFQQAGIYVQNLSSQLAVVKLDPQPGEEVLDLAAAPGGKTLLIAACMHQEGRLAAVEAIRDRFFRLQANLKQYGATHVHTYLADGRTIGQKTPNRFDRILLDAPCSSESRFHVSRPESWSRWSSRKIREQSRKQVGLLRSALCSLKVGGTMIYCTCSFAPEENELVVLKQLEWFGSAIDILPCELPIEQSRPGVLQWNGQSLPDDLARCKRILPNSSYDGFFICRLGKNRELGIEIEAKPRYQERRQERNSFHARK